MTILSATELRTHIETDLSDTALGRLGSAAEQLIIRAAGDITALTEIQNEQGYPGGRERIIYLARTVTSITSVKEREHFDDDQITLSADDYRQEGGRRLVRLREGTNPRLFWAPHTEVNYVPVVDSDLREIVQINLVKLAVIYSAALRETQGDFDFWHVDYAKETQGHLAQLNNSKNRMPFV